MDDDRRDHLWRRAREHRERAAVAGDARVQGIHLELASRYAQLAEVKSDAAVGEDPD